MTWIKRLREYFKQHRKISLIIELLIAILLVSISILFFGRHEGAFIGFFMYIFISNFIGTNGSFIDPDKFLEPRKHRDK
ncbi:hypothetical protein MOB44_19010 [Bacillus sonorensis]|uniref:hypothetical protein n=1 Tax=Bacillus sonorensis TaxID=119858 RepID=UPI002280DC33|nr:hypothetical protein [Bacillus sonorensis]MCY8088738.1 hypothetical protein [Bacillus sonorensis]